MQIIYDDQPGRFGTSESAPLDDLIAEAKARAAASGRMLVGINCDGLDVTGADYAKHLARPLGSYERIDLHSIAPSELAEGGLSSIAELIDETERATPAIIERLTAGDAAEALPQLGECTRVWLQIHESICNLATLLGINPNDPLNEGPTLTERLTVPTERLRQLRDALTAKDYVLVCDVLGYELPDMFKAWRDLVAALRPAAQSAIAR